MTDDLSRQSEQIRVDREQLSHTVEALAGRLDVGARAKEAADSARQQGIGAWRRAQDSPVFVPAVAGLGALTGLLVGLTWWRRRRRTGQ